MKKIPFGFIYLWFDSHRNMFYVGSHAGSTDDGYVSSSRWLNGEIRFRPEQFKRRVLEYVDNNSQLRTKEYNLIRLIKDEEFGTKYYNLRCGRKKGCMPHNKGKPMSEGTKKTISDKKKGIPAHNKGKPMSDEQKLKISNSTTGRKSHNKGKPNQLAASNGKRGATALSVLCSGRVKYAYGNGKWTWAYPAKTGKYFIRKRINNKKWEEIPVDISSR